MESHEAELIACAERRALARAARQRNHRPGRVGVALARLLVTMAARTPVSCTVGAPR